MGGWRDILTPAEIIDLMRYIRTLVGPLPVAMTPGEFDVRVGEQIYQKYCIGCHGEQGDGQTPLGSQLIPHPRDFTSAGLIAATKDPELAHSITRGLPGSAMAGWERVLSKQDI